MTNHSNETTTAETTSTDTAPLSEETRAFLAALAAAPVPDPSVAEEPTAEELVSFAAPGLPGLAGFPMVVVLTQDAINFQFKKLWQSDQRLPKTLDLSFEQMRLTAELDPPLISLHVPGARPGDRVALFTLRLRTGKFVREVIRRVTVDGQTRREIGDEETPIKDWKLTFKVNLDIVSLAAAHDKATMPRVIRELVEFKSDQFHIRKIFLNLEDANLLEYDEKLTEMKVNGADLSPEVVTSFVKILSTSLKQHKQDRPYVLAYSVTPAKTRPPAIFEPTGATFSTFVDKNNPGQSCLQFLLMTRHQELPGGADAGIFSESWMTRWKSAEPGAAGRMIVSTDEFNTQYFAGVLLKGVRDALTRTKPDEMGLVDEKFAWYEDGALLQSMRAWVNGTIPSSEDGQKARQKYFENRVPGKFEDFFPGITKDKKGWAVWHCDTTLHLCDGWGAIIGEEWTSGKVYRQEATYVTCGVFARAGHPIRFSIGGQIHTHVEVHTRRLTVDQHWGGYVIRRPFGYDASITAGADGKLVLTLAERPGLADSEESIKGGDAWAGHESEVSAARPRSQRLKDAFCKRLNDALADSFKAFGAQIVLPAGDLFFFKNPQLDNDGRLYVDITFNQADYQQSAK